jgi:hypothetical protein
MFCLSCTLCFSDPLALLGMCQESYAHFLTMEPGRAYDSMVLFNQASQIVNELFGMMSSQAVVMYNNFGVQWLFANKFVSRVSFNMFSIIFADLT